MRKSLRLVAMVAALAMVATACASDDDPEADGDTDGDTTEDTDTDEDEDEDEDADEDQDSAADGDRRRLRFGGYGADLQSVDPHIGNAGPDRQVYLLLYNGLVRYIPGDPAAGFEPDIATEVPETPDAEGDGTQVWEFEIKDDVMCHPAEDGGEPRALTVDEVVASYNRSMDEEISAFAGDYGVVESVEASGDNTVAFTLSEARSAALFLPLVADISAGYVLCMDDVPEEAGLSEHPPGTGPFVVTDYSPGESITFDAFDDYFRGAPQLAGIDMPFMPDDSSRTLALQSGDVDMIVGVREGEWIERINSEEGLDAFGLGVGGLVHYHLNTTMEPFDDLNVRRAIMYATDREQHVALGGEIDGESFYTPTYSTSNLPGGIADLDQSVVAEEAPWITEYNPEEAQALLEEAGMGDGFSFDVVSSESANYRNNYEVLQASLSEIGVEMNIDVVDHPTMHETIRENANPVVWYTAPRPTTDLLMNQFLHGDSAVGDSCFPESDTCGSAAISNFANYAGIDDLLGEAQAELDPAAQEALWEEASLQAMSDGAIYPSHHGGYGWAKVEEFDFGYEPQLWLHSSSAIINETSHFTD